MQLTPITQDTNIPVGYVEAPDGPSGAPLAFKQLEKAVGSLKGRKYYGIVDFVEDKVTYKAAVAIAEGEQLSLPGTIIAAGNYVRYKMKNWQERIPEIGPAMMKMNTLVSADRSRPEIEYYYRHNELHLWLPVK